MKFIIALALVPSMCHAVTWVNFGGVSLHTKSGYNSQNPGFGIQQDIDTKDFVAFGGYINSFDEVSRYMTFGRRFVSDGVVSAGLFGGVVDGYSLRNHGGFDYIAAPFAEIDGRRVGVDLLFLPPAEKGRAAALSLQFKVRLD